MLSFQVEPHLFLVLAVLVASSEEKLTYSVRENGHSLEAVCVGVIAGIFPHPDPTFCNAFVSCTFEQPTAHQCSDGFIFDPIIYRCVQGDQEQCTDRTPEPDWREFCVNVTYAFYEHPNSCKEFVFCSLGTANRYSCPLGEIWSQRDGACLPGSWDTCELLIDETSCEGQPDGVLPYPTDCSRYIVCVKGDKTIIVCPRGAVFEQKEGKCVIGNTESCVRIDNKCQGKLDGTIVVHPNECDLYVICQGGYGTVHQCPMGEILNIQAQFCAPGNVDTCQFYSQEIMCRNATNGAIYPLPGDCTQFIICNSGESIAMNCPVGQILHAPSGTCRPGNTNTCELLGSVCYNQPDGLIIAHPTLCEIFILCQGGSVMIRSCPDREILRPDAQSCVPGDVNTCLYDSIDRMCENKADFTRYPHPTNCSLFVECQGQNALVQSCPNGSVYHAGTQSCIPGNDETCERFDNICLGHVDKVIPHPLICTAYIHCFSTVPVFMNCAAGTVFNRAQGRCVVGNTKTCAPIDGLCEGQTDGRIVAHPNECDLYLICEDHQPAPQRCPAGEIFNVEAQLCTPGSRDTCQFHPVETMCKNMIDNAIYPYPNDCIRFVQCDNGKAIVMDCPIGEIFHASSKSCRPGNTKTCEFIDRVCQGHPDGQVIEHPSLCGHFIWCQGESVQVHACPPGEILRPDAQFCVPGNPSTCTFEPVERMCMGISDGNVYPHPTDCRLFVRCENSQAIVETCRPGTIFRATSQTCVAGNGNTCSFLDGTCAGRPDGVLPHPQGCELFLLCTSGTTSALRCPEGEILHPEFLVCATGNADDCTLAPVTTEPPIISVCEGRPDGNYTHPLLCYLFIRCTNGDTEILSCPPNQIFVGAIRDCASGNQETCIPV
ncbi:multiple epidermal growth factor-like domains protein 10 [Anopheles maculipalpis]|uniref:multiple epidermal growth factor-like domains protein 10 n=1 Tax=Anopheles maculipalpis TaxID=1496333 RepID=UPI002158D89E|nr:multiple epidermal growth factor-like domains protein 10 [Anopheles maculipalpis]